MKRKIFLRTQDITPVLFAPDDAPFYSQLDQLETNMNCQEKTSWSMARIVSSFY